MAKSAKKSAALDKRQQIVAAAIRCYQEYGVIGTTFTQIAKAAKVHQPLISYHFPTFEDLFTAVAEVVFGDLRQDSVAAIAAQSNDPEKALMDYVFVPLLWSKQKPQFNALLLFFYHLASYQARFKDMNQQIRNVGRERISLLIYRYQEAKKATLQPPWTVEVLAWAIQAQITGAITMAISEHANADEAGEICQKAVAALLQQAFK